ncbi:MAG: 16S rRNA (cytidine(1402)-2'-O)-methyltransferase [Clostridia bacterium]|nr:16S rRNA (cytidine(1402)-2'-O)-methyltransferase [Clostridia bacterium]
MTLYLVATPIGNLEDITYRAVKVLSEVDFIAAEDTRNTPKLLQKYGIKKPLVSYFEHNKRERGEYIVSRLESGESCALVTDAGTPAISDPGEDLVALCIERGIKVTSLPGACAAITALTLSGLSTKRFCFEGFLTYAKGSKKARLQELAKETRTVIIYEAPHHLCATLDDLYEAFGDRRVAFCRELTKINEEAKIMMLSEAIAYYNENKPRGEFVLVIEGADDKPQTEFDMSIKEHVQKYIDEGMSKMDAIKAAAKDRGLPKSTVYAEINK